jgi:RHS repeat-associated protein
MRDSIVAGSVYRSTVYKYQSSDGIRLEKVTDPLSRITEYTYYTNGRLNTEKDYLNNTITYQYDELGRQTYRSTTFGDQLTTTYAWESVSGSPRYSIQTSGNDGSSNKRYYDKLRREVKSDIKGFDGNMITTTTEYNIKGQLYRISEPASTTAWNVYSYNNYGQITGITRPSGRNSSWSYTGPSVTETVAGKSFIKTFNSAGLVISANDNGGTITYAYLPNGKLKYITAPGNITTSFKYDYADNQIKLIDPSAGIITYAYNAFGELASQQNTRGQTTSITYYNDGRINEKITPEATATYCYDNTTKQLIRVKLSTGINHIYQYDSKGRIITDRDSIESVIATNNYTYDSYGRLSTITHPSGITETRYYKYGYPQYVKVGSTTYWTINKMNVRNQITEAKYGSSLIAAFNYDNYGYPISTVTGSIQNYMYSFNTATGNLSWRMNVLRSGIQESFEYDNLDRLDRVYSGSTTLLDMAYTANKGGISTKSDVGTLNYNRPGKPYALSSINPSTGLISSSMNDSMAYTSFESIKTIIEGVYRADFSYNCINQRAKMVVQQNGSPINTRWYKDDTYMREDAGGVVKEYTFIGGDAYSAPVVAIKQSGSTNYYYLLRDNLGSITHVVNTSNSVVAEYSYDAWGRMRDPTTLAAFNPGSEPSLFTGRGFTGHEHLPWFKLINMNGRSYDPLTGQFLSADNYVQAPYFTQSFNRFAYCLNNPLKYTDPSGMYAAPTSQMEDGITSAGAYSANLDLYGRPLVDIGLSSGFSFNINSTNIWNIINYILNDRNCLYGAYISYSTGVNYYGNDVQALWAGMDYVSSFNGWQHTEHLSLTGTYNAFNMPANIASVSINLNSLPKSALAQMISPGFGRPLTDYDYSPESQGGNYNDQYAGAVEKLEGKPYVYGADGPDAYDCSSTACYGIRTVANAKFGDYSADGLFRKFSIPSNSHSRGSVIFYDYTSDGRIDHVTTIINSKDMLHPSSGAGVLQIKPIHYLDNYTNKQGGIIYYREFNWQLIINKTQ